MLFSAIFLSVVSFLSQVLVVVYCFLLNIMLNCMCHRK